MKLSFKLEDEHSNQIPILKAKVPITIFNRPFTSSLTTTTPSPTTTPTTPKDVSFSLSTSFLSGPSLKFIYTPSSSSSSQTNPFTLSLKSGLGLFGSPRNSPLTFTANFSPSTNTPSFSLHFKPQFGDFSLHRSTSSTNSGSQVVSGGKSESGSPPNGEIVNGFGSDGKIESWQEIKLEPFSGSKSGVQNPNPNDDFDRVDSNNGFGFGFVPQNPIALRSNKKGAFFPGVAVKARTVLPLTKRVVVNLRWGLNFNPNASMKMPYLTLSKIGIERLEDVKVEEVDKKSDRNNAADVELLKGTCFWMSRDLETMAKENREMVQCLEDMKSKVSVKNSYGKSESIGMKVTPILGDSSNEFERWKTKKNSGEGNVQRELKKNVVERNGQRELKKPGKPVSDVEAELQRAIQAAASS